MQDRDGGRIRIGDGGPAAAVIERHLARGRALQHAPLTADRIPVIRQFLADSGSVAIPSPHPPARRLQALRAALARRLGVRLRSA